MLMHPPKRAKVYAKETRDHAPPEFWPSMTQAWQEAFPALGMGTLMILWLGIWGWLEGL